MSQWGVSQEKAVAVCSQVTLYTKPYRVSWACLELSMIQVSCGQRTCVKEQAVWRWSPREVIDSSPSVSCFLGLQGWFHLRSSCLCCSLITLNFLEGERHVISWGLILVCTVWKFPVFYVIFKMFLFVRESDLSSFLAWLPLRCHSQIKVSSSVRMVLSASSFPLYAVFTWVSLPESLKSVMKY